MKKIDLTDIGINYKDIISRINKERMKLPNDKWKEIKKLTNLSSQQFTNVFGKQKVDPSIEMIIKIAHYLDKPIDYFLYGKEETREDDIFKTINIPCIEPILSKDLKIVIKSEKNIYIDKKFGKSKKLYCLKIEGNLMYPTINGGDQIIIDYSKKYIIEGKIHVFHNKDIPFLQIRRLYFYCDKIKVVPDNPEYEPYLILLKNIKIIGQVVNIFKHLL